MNKRSFNPKKIREEEQAIGAIYKQYIDTFQESSDIQTKVFVRSDTLYAEEGKGSVEKGQLYSPRPLIRCKREEARPAPAPLPLPKKRAKAKSNLRSLGDELKMLQHERMSKEAKVAKSGAELGAVAQLDGDYGASTNLFVSNLSPQVTESHLIKLFGTYGPLASVKIMWPRGEEVSRSANCGFVAFMSRSDAERALGALKTREDMRINWGKSVKIPPHPVHIPPELCKLYSPPPPSGLPFNAQIVDRKSLTAPGGGVLASTVVKVTIPFDRNQLMLIHRTIEFVIREGAEFEALVVARERGNADFAFLCDYQSPAHTYYRWKLFSMLNGDPKNSWSMAPFRMFKGGSIWVPPVAPNYADGMPKELIAEEDDANLSEAQTARLVYLIKHLKASRQSVARAMAFCLNHAGAINDAVDVLADSFKDAATHPLKKLARLYLLSDILHNCRTGGVAVDKFDDEAHSDCCLDIFRELHRTSANFAHSSDRDNFQLKVFKVLRAWLFFRHYDAAFVTKLENVFLCGNEQGDDDDNSLNDEPLDGANLIKRSSLTTATDCLIVNQRVDIFDPNAYAAKSGKGLRRRLR